MIKALCYLLLKAQGWKFEVAIPQDVRSFIFLGAPHTSNYDFVPAMAMSHLMRRNAKFVIKNDWMRFPLNIFMGPLGAIGLDRNKLKAGSGSNTDIMAQLFQNYQELVLMIAPEGTRGANANWKTGFYYIAQKAHVPIVLGFADYKKKILGTGPVIYPQAFEADMRKIMSFYEDIQGLQPLNFRIDLRYKN